jgi:hypothetical protein
MSGGTNGDTGCKIEKYVAVNVVDPKPPGFFDNKGIIPCI